VLQGLDGSVSMSLLSNVYVAAQFVVLLGVLLWLYRRDRGVYRRLRDTVLATWMLSVPIYALFPCAPPRPAGIGMADTVSGVALFAAGRTRWTAGLALLWGPLVCLTVVATGNHYFFDIATGLLVSVAGYATGRRLPTRPPLRLPTPARRLQPQAA
jgi:hypothetical protein